ncbi:MAG: glycosyltransferase [Prochlorococcaceae cyanobacterium]
MELAFAIAERLPELPFLFCEGWPQSEADWQRLEARCAALPNVTLVRRTTDMRTIYGRTRVLLVPSQWEEAWGRVVTEAQASGIPSLVSTVGGLAETAGIGGLALAPDAPPGLWAETLQRLWQDQAFWQMMSSQARAQADFLRGYYAEATQRMAASLESHWLEVRSGVASAQAGGPAMPPTSQEELHRVVDGLAERGREAMRSGDWGAAERIWQPLIDHFSPALLSSWHNQLARALYESRQFDRLLQLCERMQALFPDNGEGFWRVAQVRMRQGDWAEAARLWELVFDRFSSQARPFWYEGLANSLIQTGRHGQAREVAMAATERFPDSPMGAVALARSLANEHRWPEAADAWEKLFAHGSGRLPVMWHQERCEALMRTERAEAAQQASARFSAEHPQNHQAWRTAARTAMLRGECRDAILSLEVLEARYPNACTPWDLEHLAFLQAGQGRHDLAEAVCDRGQTRFPDDFKGIRSFRLQHERSRQPGASGLASRYRATLRLLAPSSQSAPVAVAPALPPGGVSRDSEAGVSLYSWPGYLRSNAFMLLLQAGLKQSGAQYIGIDMPSGGVPLDADILLIQFPDVLGWRERSEDLPARMLEELEGLEAWRRQGTCLLWLVHNCLPHDLGLRQRLLWQGFHRRLGRLCDGFLAMGPSLRKEIEREIPTLAGKPFASFCHPRYPIPSLVDSERRQCRAGLGVGDGELLVGALGTISRYKGLVALVRMVQQLGRTDVRLLIAGQPRSPGILAELEEAIGEDPTILLRPSHLPAETFAAYTQACDRIVIPNERYLTSGALIYALSAGRPVLARRTPYSMDVRSVLGASADYVHLHEDRLDPETLRSFLEAPPPCAPVEMARFSSADAGASIIALHREIRDSRAPSLPDRLR